jgi:hypothetical protein
MLEHKITRIKSGTTRIKGGQTEGIGEHYRKQQADGGVRDLIQHLQEQEIAEKGYTGNPYGQRVGITIVCSGHSP